MQVVGRREMDRDGYTAVQLGAGKAKAKNVAKPQRAAFGKAEVEPKARVAEFRVAEDALLDVGAHISADHFVAGQLVDVAGVTQGKGFAGAMKRWDFGGLRATHGVSVSHRSHGSTGNRQDPGRVFKNKKMAGHMGARNRTQQNLEVVRTDPIRGLLFIKGSVPGHKGSWLTVSDAIKLPRHESAPYPAGILDDQGEDRRVEAAGGGPGRRGRGPRNPGAAERRGSRGDRGRAGSRRCRRGGSRGGCRELKPTNAPADEAKRRGRSPLPTRARKAKMKVKVQTLDAKAGGDIELNDEIFAVEPRADILHRVVTWQLDKRRGTGPRRARAQRRCPHRQEVRPPEGRRHRSSRRSPRSDLHRRRQGPRPARPRFNPSLNKKVRALGLKMALSSKAKAAI